MRDPSGLQVQVRNLGSKYFSGKHLYRSRIQMPVQKARVSGTGVSKSLALSWVKALMELAEGLIVREQGLSSRVGLAGGFIRSSAIRRAKA